MNTSQRIKTTVAIICAGLAGFANYHAGVGEAAGTVFNLFDVTAIALTAVPLSWIARMWMDKEQA